MIGSRALVCQLGARGHYLTARCLARQGLLACLATDFWNPIYLGTSAILRRLPRVALVALGRNHSDLKDERIASFPSLGIARYMLALFDKQCRQGKRDDVIAKLFARCVRSLDIRHDVFWGYSYDSLELLQHERESGVFTILCQTDPGPAHYRMIREEDGRWPEYTVVKARPWEQQRAERLRQE